MENSGTTYLTTRNIMLILAAWAGLNFVVPGANFWLRDKSHFAEHWKLYLGMEVIFYMLCFAYKALLDKDYRRALFLAAFGALDFAACFYLCLFRDTDTRLIFFFHPITLSLAAIFAAENKYGQALGGYMLGYFFSHFPLVLSLVPVLFLQLWLGSLPAPVTGTKLSRFLTRSLMYLVTSIPLLAMFRGVPVLGGSFPVAGWIDGMFISAVLATGVIYRMLYKYLSAYYAAYGNSLLKRLSYIPVLWLVPLLGIVAGSKKPVTEEPAK